MCVLNNAHFARRGEMITRLTMPLIPYDMPIAHIYGGFEWLLRGQNVAFPWLALLRYARPTSLKNHQSIGEPSGLFGR